MIATTRVERHLRHACYCFRERLKEIVSGLGRGSPSHLPVLGRPQHYEVHDLRVVGVIELIGVVAFFVVANELSSADSKELTSHLIEHLGPLFPRHMMPNLMP